MELTISSNLNWVARLRYIQAVYEPPERRGPDNLVRRFFPLLERLRYQFLSKDEFDKMREEPFYYYLLARTRYYDEVFSEAICGNARYIVNVGCGSDTRAHRFIEGLKERNIKVLECDQPDAISVKQRMAKRLGPTGHIEYLAIDLNDDAWPNFGYWLDQIGRKKAMVMMEGVSQYINGDNFVRFLGLLQTKLLPGTVIAYDLKFQGAADTLGRVGRTENPFRLSASKEVVMAYHKKLGFHVTHLELSCDLEARLLPDVADSGRPLFQEDCLVQMKVE